MMKIILKELLTNLEDVQDRRAQFVCVISMSALMKKQKHLKEQFLE